jgi:hypothetical protein
MKVAVPEPQHSPMLGQRADWQTVWSLYLLTTSLTLSYVGPMGSLTFSQGGLWVTAAIPYQMQSVGRKI